MSTRVKAGLCFAIFVALYGLFVYTARDGSQALAKEWIALGPIH